MSAPSTPVAPRRAALAFIFFTLLLDILALGVCIPVLPRIVSDFLGGDTAHAARDHRPVRHALGAHAVHLLASDGGALGSLRPAAGDPPVQPGAGAGLHPHGPGAEPGVAVRGPHHLGHHRGEHQHGQRLRGGRDAAGQAGRQLRHARGSVRRGLRARAGARGRAGTEQPPPALLGGGGPEPRQCPLRAVRPARVPAARAPQALPVAPRQPAGRADVPALEPRGAGSGGGALPPQLLAHGPVQRVRALRGLPLRLGSAHRGADDGVLGDVHAGGAGRAGAAGRQAARRAQARCSRG